ncbi:MAG TPA: DUF896 domain-containing protein [Candidatus Bathyarchaeia archaeon]|nr:DUF896 domain-containing protein [Candidatus Bathyarchaeia archaeon]
MISEAEIKRINELSKKAKGSGLSAEEKEEQQALRRKYIDAMKASLKSSLDSIRYVEDLDENGPKH